MTFFKKELTPNKQRRAVEEIWAEYAKDIQADLDLEINTPRFKFSNRPPQFQRKTSMSCGYTVNFNVRTTPEKTKIIKHIAKKKNIPLWALLNEMFDAYIEANYL